MVIFLVNDEQPTSLYKACYVDFVKCLFYKINKLTNST